MKPIQPNRESQVQQSAAKSADINHMVQQHLHGPGRLGKPIGDPNATRQPRFMEVPSASFHEMLIQVTDIQNEFRGLPAKIRNRFQNDPFQMLRFVENPRNRKEAIKMGLIIPTEEEYQEMKRGGVQSKMVNAEQLDLSKMTAETVQELREALKADPESQPDYSGKPAHKPPEGAKKS